MPIPNDPMLSQQWHLGTTVAGHFDLNVRQVWAPSAGGTAYNGTGIRVFVLDDGFDYNHPDFDRYNRALDWDFRDGDADPFGDDANEDFHGTAVAGLIGAAGDGTGAVGVAFGVEFAGFQLAGDLYTEAAGIRRAAIEGKGDVINLSWGVPGSLDYMWGHGYERAAWVALDSAIGAAVAQGRGGLGTTLVQAAGNDRGKGIETNADGWGQDTRQVVVAAVDKNGVVSDYSNAGATLLVSAFGTPSQVVTTDRVGAPGYSSGNFTTEFDGTSAAAPMVAGVVSLMYDANAGLGWRDVQSILAASARHVGSGIGADSRGPEQYGWGWNGAKTWNGGGMHFSNDYGYGLVDATAAVRMAESWLLGPDAAKNSNQASVGIDVLNATKIVADGSSSGADFAGNFSSQLLVERATVSITMEVGRAEDLRVWLTSAKGTENNLVWSVPAKTEQGAALGYKGTWTFESQAFRGERAAGEWLVHVQDSKTGATVKLTDVQIKLFGANTTDDRYIFTNEYSNWVGKAGHGKILNDGNGGDYDVVNAAAVTTNSIIRLTGAATSRIDGVTLTIGTSLDDAVGGDGTDILEGNGFANMLSGMRRNDVLLGRAGVDTLYGDHGNDVLTGGAGLDSLFGGAGNDVFDFNIRSESVGSNIDQIRGKAGQRAFDGAGAAAGDRIDLSNIDGREGTTGHQDLLFRTGGTAMGTFKVIERGDGASRVLAYTNGTAGADLIIDILDGAAVAASKYTLADFIL